MLAHLIAFCIGFILDMIFADPYSFPHPILFVGKFISFLEKKLLTDSDKKNLRRGVLLTVVVVAFFSAIYFVISFLTYRINIWFGMAVEAFLTYQLLAAKSLERESMKVYDKLENGTIDEARYAVSMIVGRDTKALDKRGVIKATVETIAENASDGVIAPMFFMAIGGPVLGIFYKATNTLDSMVGYKNDKYLYFGRASAKFDDILNFIPARISGLLMIVVSYINSGSFGKRCFFGRALSGSDALRIYKRDRNKHASPNSAHTESVCAGALQVQLAGDASYFGKIYKKPTIGDDIRSIETDDIKRANRLMIASSVLFLILALAVMSIITLIMINYYLETLYL